MNIDIEQLKRLAEAAGTEHPWGWHSDPVKGNPLGRSRYEITTLGRTITRTYYSDETALNEARFIAAANPQTVLELIEEIEDLRRQVKSLESAIAKQAKAAISGMDAAKAHAGSMLAAAEKARAESSPDALASERAANAALTEEVEQLQAENKELAAFVIACGGFWGNSKSKLLGSESLHAVIECAFSEAAEAEKLQAENAKLKSERDTFRHGHRVASDNYVRLERELEEARKDAERYRKVKCIPKVTLMAMMDKATLPTTYGGKSIDESIDEYPTPIAAIAARQHKG